MELCIEADRIIGENIHAARKRAGLSSDLLARMVSEQSGESISGRTIRMYESGKRTCPIGTAVKIAVSLGCSLQTIIAGVDPRSPGEGLEFRLLTKDESKILRDIATKWTGDVHALIVFTGLYAALPPKYRREAPLSLLTMMERALTDGAITEEDLPEDIEYMEARWRELYK